MNLPYHPITGFYVLSKVISFVQVCIKFNVIFKEGCLTMIRVISITKSSAMIPCLWSVVPSTSLIKRKNPRTILVTTINVVTLPCLSFYLLDFSVSLFSYEMSQHQKNENFYLFSILHTKSPLLSYEEGTRDCRKRARRGLLCF